MWVGLRRATPNGGISPPEHIWTRPGGAAGGRGALHRGLLSIRQGPGLPAEVSALRVFDVIAWMDGVEPRPGRRL
ncbi:DUF6308 family protein [Rhodococcus opacus]|uniref:DUF6308 family protein n=1 Tax=Rhodococcus opacus TaxID=37919 RepID=UPI002235F2AF|nr:DUF6308 family protein [Rhodococcus opacus]UZG60401.1 DUF6308 family protein [Rhodococcus opacus]